MVWSEPAARVTGLAARPPGALTVTVGVPGWTAWYAEAEPKASFLIFDPANPYKYIELRGDAEITPDGDYSFADRLGAKYGGADLRERDEPGETRVVVTISPVRVVAWG